MGDNPFGGTNLPSPLGRRVGDEGLSINDLPKTQGYPLAISEETRWTQK